MLSPQMVDIIASINVDGIIKMKETCYIILDMNVEYHDNIDVIIVKLNICTNQN